MNGEAAPEVMLVCKVAVFAAAANKATVSVPLPEAAVEPNCALLTVNVPLPSGAV